MNSRPIAAKLARIVNLRDFALKAGIPRRTLYHVMQGTHAPTKRTVLRIRTALVTLKPALRSVKTEDLK